MSRWRAILAAALIAALTVAVAAYLYDPPWVGSRTFGLRDWEQDAEGNRFRWTAGHATFYVPSAATAVTLPMRPFFPRAAGEPVLVSITVDDRRLAELRLEDPLLWARPTLLIPHQPSGRRFRRIDVRVNRTFGFFLFGVQLGPVELREDP